ncbi:MAG: hypothetical protein MJZ84_02785 [Paludibacteraceae bacterium]|nr:hypothetical protein [Paludibacteraceae bacterium]
MRKIFSLFAALTLSAGLWAIDNVPYIDANGQLKTANGVTEITNASTTLSGGWYVVYGADVQTGTLICQGDVHLILCDGAKLTATGSNWGQAGINVTGTNSLTIYAQSTNPETMGQLIANGASIAAGIGGGDNQPGNNITINGGKVTAKGGTYAAGIGGGQVGSGSNITINGGEVTANGGDSAAGIGGGMTKDGSNITINGGVVTANGGDMAAGIGGGIGGSGFDIYISDAYVLEAGAAANPTEVINHSSATNLGSSLNGKRYAKIEGLATPYTRTTSVDQWATVCLPYAATSFEGADFYKVNYYDASDPTDLKLYIEPVVNLEAGKPYIFHATDETVTIEHNATTPEEISAGYENGLYGSFARKTIVYDAEHAYAALANNTVNVIGAGHTVTVPACRAYFDMTEVPTTEQPHSAPLRCISIPSKNPTDLGQSAITNHKSAMKVVKNGQFRIVRDNKMYNAQGVEIQ